MAIRYMLIVNNMRLIYEAFTLSKIEPQPLLFKGTSDVLDKSGMFYFLVVTVIKNSNLGSVS